MALTSTDQWGWELPDELRPLVSLELTTPDTITKHLARSTDGRFWLVEWDTKTSAYRWDHIPEDQARHMAAPVVEYRGLADWLELFSGAPGVRTREPITYLWNWTEILDAVGVKDTTEIRSRISRYNKMHAGPIIIPVAGGRPMADRAKLVKWWNGLESRFQDLQQRRQDQQATVADQYSYGSAGTVVPGIDGSVKRRRTTKKNKTTGPS